MPGKKGRHMRRLKIGLENNIKDYPKHTGNSIQQKRQDNRFGKPESA